VAVEKSSSPFLPPLFAAERVDGRLEALAEAVFEIDLGRGVAAGAFEAAARRGRVDAETGGACAALRAGMICVVFGKQINCNCLMSFAALQAQRAEKRLWEDCMVAEGKFQNCNGFGWLHARKL
jgi:hypothetical protein